MKKTICLFLGLLVVQPSFANVDADTLVEKEVLVENNEKVKIKEIKSYLSTVNPSSTCMDEYLKRRKQLIIKIGMAPVTIAAGGLASVYLGVAAGSGVAYITGAHGSWDALGYVLGGAMVGVALTSVVITADTALGVKHVLENDLILKAIAESHLDRSGEKMDILYNKVTKKMNTKPTKDDFIEKLIAIDASGELCDGSLVKQPRIRLGTKLKYKVARIKHLRTIF